MWKPFLLHSSLPLVHVPSLFFCLRYFFFLLPYPSTWGVSCLLGGLTSSASVQWVFCRSSSTCRCIPNVSEGRKVISASYSSAILPRPPEVCLLCEESCSPVKTSHGERGTSLERGRGADLTFWLCDPKGVKEPSGASRVKWRDAHLQV